MWRANPQGGGVAWRDLDKKKVPIVRWKKGLSLKEMQEMIATLPLPFVAHFRVASCGGPLALLTHPFPIAKDSPLTLEGSTKGQVLFHNGHWGQWKEAGLKMASRGIQMPPGRWSDSRTMAWLAAHAGIGVLDFIEEKVVVFGPEGEDQILGNGWVQVGDLLCSNSSWEVKWTNVRGRDYQGGSNSPSGASGDEHRHPPRALPSGTTTPTTEAQSASGRPSTAIESAVAFLRGDVALRESGGLTPQEPFRPGHPRIRLEENEPQGVQEGEGTLRQGPAQRSRATKALTPMTPEDIDASISGAYSSIDNVDLWLWARGLNPKSYSAAEVRH